MNNAPAPVRVVMKIQRVRSCAQCGRVLTEKCPACTAHPDRKPQVWTYYEWPPILEVCPCRCSVRIACQRAGCTATRWVNRTHSRGGLAKFEKLYCSRACNLMVIAEGRRANRVKANCAWGPCGKAIDRRPCEVTRSARSFCRPDHYFLWRAKKMAEEAEIRRAAKDEERKRIEERDRAERAKERERQRREERAAFLVCCSPKCRGAVTEHQVVGGRATCQVEGCGRERDASVRSATAVA